MRVRNLFLSNIIIGVKCCTEHDYSICKTVWLTIIMIKSWGALKNVLKARPVKSNQNWNKFSPTAFIVWKNIYSDRISDKAVWLNCSMTCSIWHFQILSHWHDDVVFKIVVSQNQSKQLTTMEKIYRKKERKRKQTKKQTK